MARTVLVVDDHAGFRAVARDLLHRAGYQVVAEAGTIAEALDRAAAQSPDAVLLDVQLSDGEGFEIVDSLMSAGARVVIVSARDRAAFRTKLRRCPGVAFIWKQELSSDRLKAALG